MDPSSLWCWRQWGSRPAVKDGKQAGTTCTLHVLQRSKDLPKEQLQDGVATTPRHWDRSGRHPLAGQSSLSHNLFTENWTLSTPPPPPQTEKFPFRRMSVRHRSSIPLPHPAVLPHLRHFETPDMAQSGGYPTGSFRDRMRHCGRLRTSPYSSDWGSSMAGKTEEEEVTAGGLAFLLSSFKWEVFAIMLIDLSPRSALPPPFPAPPLLSSS